ncbi:MAG: tRNA lysidine(34) synthetase TilS, partial [Bacillota bacterium]|nr:tRNA lysidine(34) synthetase TilS [Bacillota bacterium]
EKIETNIKKYNLIKEGQNILIGLSGGPDSVMLLHVLRIFKKKKNFNLYAAHINHLYRGEDAYKDEEFVRKLCEDFNVQLYIKRQNASILAKENKITEEEAGREIRYGFFNKILKEIGGGLIATAHNKNDQAETLLQRMIRGTGIEGLTGMDYKQDNIIRPLLNIDKEEILKYLEINSFNFCIDKTNTEPIYGRNKIRLELIPYIEKTFNENFQDTLFRMSQNMKDDYKIINRQVENNFSKCLISKDKERIILDIDTLKKFPKGIRSRILRNSIEYIKGNKVDVERKHIDYLDGFMLKKETGKSIDLGDSVVGEISYNKLIIRNKGKIKNYVYNLEKGINFIKEINKSIKVSHNGKNTINEDKNSIIIDSDIIKGQLKVRNRQNGDKFQPLGMKGSKKIKDYFIDEKIPAKLRNEIPLICDDESIIWIAGYRMNHNYRITEKTLNTTKIEIVEV